jgi:diketogulonate reductase-like aldo/keto reductase
LTQGKRLRDRKLVAVAEKYPSAATQRPDHGLHLPFAQNFSRRAATKSTAQILIRWALQHGLAVIPKSGNRNRIFENADVFDFELTAEDMGLLDGFNENLRTCWDPTNAP